MPAATFSGFQRVYRSLSHYPRQSLRGLPIRRLRFDESKVRVLFEYARLFLTYFNIKSVNYFLKPLFRHKNGLFWGFQKGKISGQVTDLYAVINH